MRVNERNEMFNRKLEVDVVKKKSKDIASEQTGPTFEDKAEVISHIFDRAAMKVGFAVCAYVILDTVRKVVVASVTE